jgi:hypothetical protein
MKKRFSMVPLHSGLDTEVIWVLLFNSTTFDLPQEYSRVAKRLGMRGLST